MSRWFRFNADAMRNPKVARLSDREFRLWVELLCVASENEGAIPPLEDLKHLLKRRLDHLSMGVERLISLCLIDVLEVGYEPHNWSKFQYKSDVSTNRVHKFRAKRNVSETPPHTQTHTQEEEANASPSTARKRSASKRGVGLDIPIPADWKPCLGPKGQRIVDGWPPGTLDREEFAFRSHAVANGRLAKDWDAAFGTWIAKTETRRIENGQRSPAHRGMSSGFQRDNRDGTAKALDRRLGLDDFAGEAGRYDAGESAGDSFGPVARLAVVR